MKLNLLFILVLTFLMVSCSSFEIRQDTAPIPISVEVQQARLEFKGCGVDSSVGVIICHKQDQLLARTDFAGDLTFFSYGKGCSLRKTIRAQIPYTQIELPQSDQICPIQVYYLPEYPGSDNITFPVYGIFGEVSVQPDNADKIGGVARLTRPEIYKLQFGPEYVRGAYVSRQHTVPITFNGNEVDIDFPSIGIDLIRIKLFKADQSADTFLYLVNAFSPYALEFRAGIVPDAKDPTVIHVQLPTTVSMTVFDDGSFTSDLDIKIPSTYTGIVRSYTVIGRTLVYRIEKGVITWEI